MKNIKNFKKYFESDDFVEDTLAKSDPNKPITRDDLVGKVYTGHREVPDREVVFAVEFIASGTFQSYYNASDYLKDMGYTVGSMQGGSPIGFADDSVYEYVSKWGNMTRADHEKLDGVIISSGFREGESLILFFKEPKF